jgi:hypothetical protein
VHDQARRGCNTGVAQRERALIAYGNAHAHDYEHEDEHVYEDEYGS